MSSNLVSKLTLKSVDAQPKRGAFGTVEEPLPAKKLVIFFGRAVKWDTATSQYGESFRFHGNFEGVNAETGESYKSSKLFLPEVVASLLANQIDAADGAAIDFALEIGARFADSSFGYEYTVKPLIETKGADELESLRSLVAPNVLALVDEGKKGAEAAAAAKPPKKSGAAATK